MASPVDQLRDVLPDLTEQLTVPRTLVGGQMVLLTQACVPSLRVKPLGVV